MSKIRLVCGNTADILQYQFMSLFNQYFDIEFFSPHKNYPADCVFVISNVGDISNSLVRQLDNGNKLIVSNIWEATTFISSDQLADYSDNIFVITGSVNPSNNGWKRIIGVGNLFWYLDSLWYTSALSTGKHVDFKNYMPDRINDKLFLMPMWKPKEFRDQIIHRMGTMLSNAIYSYPKINVTLPRFTKCVMDEVAINGDRTFEPYWYDHTYFTVAVETFVENKDCELFVTEKTFKPIAFQHPFLSCSMPGTLKYIKRQGFETFDNIFDEAYDNVNDFDDRLEYIVKNIEMFDVEKYNDPLTLKKMKHNHERFYDTALVREKLAQDLIYPILEFVNG